jgi:hypothetical protein
MLKLKHLLKEVEYQTPFQKGEMSGLDAELDQKAIDNAMSRLERYYLTIKPKRVDMTEFKNDVRDLISIYKDKSTTSGYSEAFFNLYPYSKTYSGWKGMFNSVINELAHLIRLEKSIQSGDTSNYGYRHF